MHIDKDPFACITVQITTVFNIKTARPFERQVADCQIGSLGRGEQRHVLLGYDCLAVAQNCERPSAAIGQGITNFDVTNCDSGNLAAIVGVGFFNSRAQ